MEYTHFTMTGEENIFQQLCLNQWIKQSRTMDAY